MSGVDSISRLQVNLRQILCESYRVWETRTLPYIGQILPRAQRPVHSIKLQELLHWEEQQQNQVHILNEYKLEAVVVFFINKWKFLIQ